MEDLQRWRRRSFAARKGWAYRRQDWSQYLAMRDHADVLTGFVRIADDLREEEYWRLLGEHVWDRPENFQPRWLWNAVLRRYPAHREAMMTREERDFLHDIPADVEVHRGAGNRENLPGFSWTLDRDRAEWFGRRFTGATSSEALSRLSLIQTNHETCPVVATGSVNKMNVIAYRNRRSENEIVTLPESVTVSRVIEL
jgi:hypothetical protein